MDSVKKEPGSVVNDSKMGAFLFFYAWSWWGICTPLKITLKASWKCDFQVQYLQSRFVSELLRPTQCWTHPNYILHMWIPKLSGHENPSSIDLAAWHCRLVKHDHLDQFGIETPGHWQWALDLMPGAEGAHLK